MAVSAHKITLINLLLDSPPRISLRSRATYLEYFHRTRPMVEVHYIRRVSDITISAHFTQLKEIYPVRRAFFASPVMIDKSLLVLHIVVLVHKKCSHLLTCAEDMLLETRNVARAGIEPA